MADEAKKPESNKIGIAALIASVGIPMAQLLVGFFEQHTTQLNNVTLEKERRRLEITKLFLDNYIGKKSDVQIATIQIMKALDPTFFISIEEGLNETTHSDTVKASIRKATVDAATEISEMLSEKKTPKVRKVLSAKEFESKANDLMSKGDKVNAQRLFQQADKEFPIYQTTTTSSFSDADSKAMKKQMDKKMDKMLDDLEKESGGKWKRVN